MFFKWCAREKVVTRSPLAEYEVADAPVPQKYMPTRENVHLLLNAVRDYWNPEHNPPMRFQPIERRSFHRQRNQALFVGLVDTSCGIGEMLNLKVDDVDLDALSVTVGKAKGRLNDNAKGQIMNQAPDRKKLRREYLRIKRKAISIACACVASGCAGHLALWRLYFTLNNYDKGTGWLLFFCLPFGFGGLVYMVTRGTERAVAKIGKIP